MLRHAGHNAPWVARFPKCCAALSRYVFLH
jgi:hypothetical protein